IEGLPRPQAAIVMQLRTGHAPLNAHLHRIQATAIPDCDHCPRIPEDVHHYLLICRKYERQRFALHRKIGRAASELSTLLNAEVKALLAYVHQTRRFRKTHGE
ncbi:hypothetical protein OE88DRAFT_1616051, partial [Heliocybe sulcata]